MVDLHPGPKAVLLLLAPGILRDPQRLDRRGRVDHPLRTINLRRQIHRGHVHRPGLGVREGLTHQRECLRELVDHVS